MDFSKHYYTAAELAEAGSAWQQAGYRAILARSSTALYYAAFFSRYRRSVCLHALSDNCRPVRRYVAPDVQLELIRI